MKQLDTELMKVKCDKCGTFHETDEISDFKDSKTYPPAAHFMCLDCNQIATVQAIDMPKRLFSHFVSKVTKERFGDLEKNIFEKMESI
jgi:uncharacterized protein YlaI